MAISCTPVILCRQPLDDAGDPAYLREISGVPIIGILNRRLRAIEKLRSPVLMMYTYEPNTAGAARKLGWITVSRNRRTVSDIAALFLLCMSDYLALTDIQFPFIDPETWLDMISKAHKEGLSCLVVTDYRGFSPMAVIRRNTALLGGIKRLLSKEKRGWLETVKDSVPKEKLAETYIKKPAISDCLCADTVDAEIIHRVGGLKVTLKSLQEQERAEGFDARAIVETARNRLYRAMLNSRLPHKSNIRFVKFESQNGLDTVRSFPVDVAITLTDRCNANCVFCNYRPGRHNCGNSFSLEDIKRMTWLKYVTKLGLGGGVGEPLANPEFLAIFRYLRIAYSHLILRIITNGILLDREMCEEFAGNLSRIRISMNAATRRTWEELMRASGFEGVCESVTRLSELKRKMNTHKPEIILLMTVSRKNVHEAAALAELAHRLGAQAVSYSFFSKSAMKRCEMPAEESMYFDRRGSDHWMDQAAERAGELGIRVFDRPLPFREKKWRIFQGERLYTVPEKCYFPWYTCYLTRSLEIEDEARMNLCCVGVEGMIGYDHSKLDEETFNRLWNHPYIRDIRRSVNDRHNPHPLCRFCRTVDQADPAYVELSSRNGMGSQQRSHNFFSTNKDTQPVKISKILGG